jgi:hypothetical protein
MAPDQPTSCQNEVERDFFGHSIIHTTGRDLCGTTVA